MINYTTVHGKCQFSLRPDVPEPKTPHTAFPEKNHFTSGLFHDIMRETPKRRSCHTNLFHQFDAIIESRAAAIAHAEGQATLLQQREQNADHRVITTLAYDLGSVCPSPIRHKVISGNKRGRVIKEIPEGENYTVISFDASHQPVAFRPVNRFGTREAHYFFEYNGFEWAVALSDEKGKETFSTVYRIERENGRLRSFYCIERSSLIGEEYSYPQQADAPVICHFYYYVPHLSNSSKDIPAGFEGSPMREYRYDIFHDRILCHDKLGDAYVFSREYSNASKKSRTTPYSQLKKWLDGLLPTIEPKAHQGVYFSLTEGTEGGFHIYLQLTGSFDPDDEWNCYITDSYESPQIETGQERTWEQILELSLDMLKRYLKSGTQKNRLLAFDGIGAGFPDGDTVILFQKTIPEV